MKRFMAVLLSYLILLQGCAGTQPVLMREVPRGDQAGDAEAAYRKYSQTVEQPVSDYETLNLAVLAYDAGDYFNSAKCLTQAEEYTHSAAPLFEQCALHYYRGLAYLKQNNLQAVREEEQRIRKHLDRVPSDSTGEDYRFGEWCAQMLGAASDTTSVGDSGRVIVICESGMMPRLRSMDVELTVYAGDQSFPPSDSSRRAYGHKLRDRWFLGNRPESGLPIGTVSSAMPVYFGTPEHSTDVWSIEAECDSGLTTVASLVADAGSIQTGNLVERQASVLAAAPVSYEAGYVQPEPVYEDDSYLTLFGGSDESPRDRPDRPQEPRQGRRERPEKQVEKKQEPAQDKKDVSKKKEPKAEKKSKTESEEKKEDKESGAGALVAGLVILLAVGVFVLAYYGIRSAVTKSHNEEPVKSDPSWEMLPVKIFAAEIPLAPGQHHVQAIFKDGNGNTLVQSDLGDVEVAAGRTVVIRARCMQ